MPEYTGPVPDNSLDVLSAILQGSESPRHEVILQVNNSYFDEGVSAMRQDNWKLIRGPPGRFQEIQAWPEPGTPVPFGQSGGDIKPGDQCRGKMSFLPRRFTSGSVGFQAQGH